MELNSFQELLEQQVLDLYSAETQLVKALPEVADSVANESLREAVEAHLKQTEDHVRRLERVAELLEVELEGQHKCKAMAGLIAETAEMLDMDGDETVIDAGIIAAAQRIEHYEISAYGSARAFAERLGYIEIADMLAETLDEERDADKTLNDIAENEVNEEAAAQDEQEALDEMEEGRGAADGGSGKSGRKEGDARRRHRPEGKERGA